jgi:4-carboxymuconolactone decarboxylase
MGKERFEKSLATRRAALGAEYVDKSIASADDFNRSMLEVVTEYSAHALWNRRGLGRRMRSINQSMLTAVNRPHEIRVQVIRAINDGLTKAGFFLQSAIYCAAPAATDGLRIARVFFKGQGL